MCSSLVSLCLLSEAATTDVLKDTHREKAPSNKTPALTKSMNMDIWVFGTSNQLFTRGSLTETKISKK